MKTGVLQSLILTKEVQAVLDRSQNIIVPESREHLLELAMGGKKEGVFEVGYVVPGNGHVLEATVTKCKNGVAVNYADIYMRRRDPDCMVIGDEKDTDKKKYRDLYGKEFEPLRTTTLDWLGEQDLIVMPFMAGGSEHGYPALLIGPANAGFFAGGLADLQGFIPKDEMPENFKPRAIIYLAPPFRHTHFDRRQVVVHNRLDAFHEIFSFNLYPGPSAKKGIYGVLLNIGEMEGWVTAHASTVQITTPYENVLTIMHEGASGGGKSEMIEEAHREVDGRLLLGVNQVSGEKVLVELRETSQLNPITDDMALCHPEIQNESKKLVVKDAEAGWFLRVDHIKEYGTSPQHEKMCIHPKEPLIFLNLDAAPGSTCLIWEHIMDAPGKRCPNPRVVMPRSFVPGVIDGQVEVDVRSFGIRSPLCTKEQPSYGIVGMMHILPPALAWLWRLVAPRGHANPSITDSEGMTSEGVGSYWPFATGKMVDQANLLLKQIISTPETKLVLIPNQHIGAYKVKFMPQWIGREYLARKGKAGFKKEQLTPSRCSLLGYSLKSLKVEGLDIPKGFLQTNLQPEVGNEGFDKGAAILTDFFKRELEKFLTPDLDPLGRKIIECCMNDGSVEDYSELLK
jgi:hypothetical protein